VPDPFSELKQQAELLPLLKLELIHHFGTTVYRTLSDESIVQEVWQREVPAEALRHTHLMHAILAISALHLWCVSEGTQSAAIFHYGLALLQLQPLVVQIAAVHILQENIKAEIANPQHVTLSYMFLTLGNR
jgi:hypothetical protein